MKNKTLVLLHGWGCDSTIWSPILPQLQQLASVIAIDLPGFGKSSAIDDFSLEVVLDFIAAQLPDDSVLMGWSLGGMLAVQLAARYPEKISHIITLATNTKFVATRDYISAMPMATNRQFNKSFAADPIATRKLFNGLLIQGDAQERALLKKMRGTVAVETITKNWAQALKLLAELDNRRVFSELTQPGLHILGAADVLVPASAASALSDLNRSQQIYLLPQAAHALHWSQPEKIVALIASFLQGKTLSMPDSDALQKNRIAQSFSRAAKTYDAVASLQRSVGETLLDNIIEDIHSDVVVDLGCGTGYFAPQLQKKFPQAYIIGVDLAEGMLAVAKTQNLLRFACVCGDAEYLPLADASVDVVFSSLALQWCSNLPLLFSELNRVLKPGGKLIFSTLGPQTLHELKTAWQQVDNYVHVNSFKSREQWQLALQINNFAIDRFEQQLPVMQFEKLTDLTRELKQLGAHNVNRGQLEGLTGRKKMLVFKAAYEQFRHNNYLPATYDVFYFNATKIGNL